MGVDHSLVPYRIPSFEAVYIVLRDLSIDVVLNIYSALDDDVSACVYQCSFSCATSQPVPQLICP